jgi:hypothetical protein
VKTLGEGDRWVLELLVQDLQVTVRFRLEVGFIVVVNPDEAVFSAGGITRACGRYGDTVRNETLAGDQKRTPELSVTNVLTGPK